MNDAGRPLTLRKRSDLVAEPVPFGSEASWTVKDPIALRFFRFREEEYTVLNLLDGRRNLQQIRDEFERKHAPQRIRPEDILRFSYQLHEQGLLISETADQGAVLFDRRTKRVRQERLSRWTSPLTIRFRGIDPQAMLDAIYPWVKPLFSRRAVVAAILLMLAALTLIAVRWNIFLEKLPSSESFFTPSTAVWLLMTLGLVKVLHEFGHGLMCRHFGGDCHELGVMLLVFTPCLYCNVSDAWRFPDKWRRIYVSAAGIYVEVILASAAVFGWWFSSEGLFHQLCLNVMIVCSVATIVFNGNPLLRYDGYYILADYVETPNLASKATSVFWRALSRLVSNPPEIEDPLLPRDHWFWYGTYHLAAATYRFALTFSIIFFLLQRAAPYHLENLVRAMAVVAFGSILLGPLKRLYRWSQASGGKDRLNRARMTATGLVGFALLLAVLFVPMPKRVWGTLEVQPIGTQRVYVRVPGTLVEQTVRPSSRIASGDVIARLDNDLLTIEIADLEARRVQLRTKIGAGERERFSRKSAADQLPELRESLAAVEEQLTKKQLDRDRLTLRAERDGLVFPAADVAGPGARDGQLRAWTGRPHDPRNLGCSLVPGDLYCEIGDPSRWEALVVIDQSDLPFVQLGMPIEIVVDELPDVVFPAHVEEIAARELQNAPQHLSNKAGGELATETDASGSEVPIATSYQVRAAIDDPRELLRLGLRGTAKIRVAWEPLGARAARWFSRTFHFRL